jgi:hypothetical protein
VVVVDISQPRIDAWNSDKLPIYEPRLDDVVFEARCGRGAARTSTHMRWSPAGPSAAPRAAAPRAADTRRADAHASRRARRDTPHRGTALTRSDAQLFPPGLPQRCVCLPFRHLLARASGRNLFFSTDVKKHIAEADVVFVRCARARGGRGGRGPGLHTAQHGLCRLPWAVHTQPSRSGSAWASWPPASLRARTRAQHTRTL